MATHLRDQVLYDVSNVQKTFSTGSVRYQYMSPRGTLDTGSSDGGTPAVFRNPNLFNPWHEIKLNGNVDLLFITCGSVIVSQSGARTVSVQYCLASAIGMYYYDGTIFRKPLFIDDSTLYPLDNNADDPTNAAKGIPVFGQNGAVGRTLQMNSATPVVLSGGFFIADGVTNAGVGQQGGFSFAVGARDESTRALASINYGMPRVSGLDTVWLAVADVSVPDLFNESAYFDIKMVASMYSLDTRSF